MAGLRLARAYTGKDDYVILEGGYHGLFDAAMWFTTHGQMVAGRRSGSEALQRRRADQHEELAHFVQANDRISWRTSSGVMRTGSRAC